VTASISCKCFLINDLVERPLRPEANRRQSPEFPSQLFKNS
jgi:hypothetical protein